MQGWHYGKGLIYLTANISANKISLAHGQRYTKGKYCNGSKKLEFERHYFSPSLKNDKLYSVLVSLVHF